MNVAPKQALGFIIVYPTVRYKGEGVIRARNAILATACLFVAAGAALCTTIGEAKRAADGTVVTVTGCVTSLETGECYIEAADRSAGIWVQGTTTGIGIGQLATVTGTKSVIDGECALTNSSMSSGTGQAIAPFSMSNRCIGGSAIGADPGILDYKPPFGAIPESWSGAGGANNTGLLVKTCGTVVSTYYSVVTNARWFVIDDDSKTVADLGDTGVLVFSDAAVQQGDFVSVTGISSVTPANDGPARRIRVVRTRNVDDVQVLKAAQKPEMPFSDEFDGVKLDTRWACMGTTGSVSLDGGGWLVVSTASKYQEPVLMQCAPGAWDLDVKLTASFTIMGCYSYPDLFLELIRSPDDMRKKDPGPTLACFYRTSEGTKAYVDPSSPIVIAADDVCYLHFERRAGNVTARLSLNGGVCLSEATIVADSYYDVFAIGEHSNIGTVTAEFDYLRFTRVNP